jgi:hypothetical protein
MEPPRARWGELDEQNLEDLELILSLTSIILKHLSTTSNDKST